VAGYFWRQVKLAAAQEEDRVFVYFNLQKRVYSVKALTGPYKGLVVAHLMMLHLLDVTPKVSEAGRKRVLAERRKNVHAGLVGALVDAFLEDEVDTRDDGDVLSYNPYKHPFFVAFRGGKRYEFAGARAALLQVTGDDRPFINTFGTKFGAQLLEAA
jgi:hypothetical protein